MGCCSGSFSLNQCIHIPSFFVIRSIKDLKEGTPLSFDKAKQFEYTSLDIHLENGLGLTLVKSTPAPAVKNNVMSEAGMTSATTIIFIVNTSTNKIRSVSYKPWLM